MDVTDNPRAKSEEGRDSTDLLPCVIFNKDQTLQGNKTGRKRGGISVISFAATVIMILRLYYR